MVGIPPFLVLTDTALAFGAMFRLGRAIAQYLARLVRECALLRRPTDWWAPAAKSVSRGLTYAEDLSFKFAT